MRGELGPGHTSGARMAKLEKEKEFCESHCASCIFSWCSQSDGCSTEACPNGCGMRMHCCKIREHMHHTCSQTIIPCINKEYGCRQGIQRQKMSSHLNHCPANIIHCGMRTSIPPRPLKKDGNDPVLIDLESKRLGYSVMSSNQNDERRSGEQKIRETEASSVDNKRGDNGQIDRETLVDVTRGEFIEDYQSHLPTDEGFLYTCEKIIPRDAWYAHAKLHCEIAVGLDVLMYARCPLKVYGCSFVATRLRPNTETGRLWYHPPLNRFVVGQKSDVAEISNSSPRPRTDSTVKLDTLPDEILQHLITFLDDTTLGYLSVVSRRMCDITRTALSGRKIVFPLWHHVVYLPSYVASWRVKQFSWCIPDRMELIRSWSHTSVTGQISRHLSDCKYYNRTTNTLPFSLKEGTKVLE